MTKIYGSFRSRPRHNGATQTFRRPSQIGTSTLSKDSSQQSAPTPTSAVYVPPHLNSNYQSYGRNSTTGDCRYSKDQMLDFFRLQEETDILNGHLQNALSEGWIPGASNEHGRNEWTRRDEKDLQNNPDICWTFDRLVQPIGLSDMTAEEKEVGLIPAFLRKPLNVFSFFRLL